MSEKGPLCLGFLTTPVLSTLGAEGGVCVGGAWNATGIPSPTLLSCHSSHGCKGRGLHPISLAGGWMVRSQDKKSRKRGAPRIVGPH